MRAKKYVTFGIDGLKEKGTWTGYPRELKIAAVEDYLNGKDSLIGICRKYGIRSNHSLLEWILKYNKRVVVTTKLLPCLGHL